MGNGLRTALVVVSVLMVGGLFYIVEPFVYCWYNHHRFNRYVRVQVDMSSCESQLSQVLGPCRFMFSFEGAEEPEALQFEGAGLHHMYDQTKRTYIVNGVGRVTNRSNVIELWSSKIRVNNQSLPGGVTQPVLVFVRSDGHLLSGYCDIN